MRFDIKQGLKNLIQESNIEIDSIASRSQSLGKIKEISITKSNKNKSNQQSKCPSLKERKIEKDEKS